MTKEELRAAMHKQIDSMLDTFQEWNADLVSAEEHLDYDPDGVNDDGTTKYKLVGRNLLLKIRV